MICCVPTQRRLQELSADKHLVLTVVCVCQQADPVQTIVCVCQQLASDSLYVTAPRQRAADKLCGYAVVNHLCGLAVAS